VAVVLVAAVAAAVGVVIGVLVGRRARPGPGVEASPAIPPSDVGDGAWLTTTVLDSLATGVVLVDRSGAVTYRNRAALGLAGTHAGVLVDEAVERHARAALQGEHTDEVVELHAKPKTVVQLRSGPADGRGAYVFVDDISERRRIDAVRTDFVANISHELKTPVGALAVLAETLADETDPAVVTRIADRMLDEAHRAARTIDDLLELSRIELGGEIVRDGVDPADVVLLAIERTEALAEQCNIHVVAGNGALPGGALRVTGDRRQLVSALGNLVENAVKYSEDGGSVTVAVQPHDEWVDFAVIDHGVGIPARDLDRIFERFYRVDKARSRGTGGTGLGLAIVRHVATNHGGDVLVTSTEGEGSTFILRIPRVFVGGAALLTERGAR